MRKEKHVYFDSSEAIESILNNSKERIVEILPSEIGFEHRDFAVRIQEAMKEIGISVEELSISTYITADKLRGYFRNQQKLNFLERKAVSKVLGF